jgi:myo-inositol-1(or 4)-monophosphatase
VLTGSGLQRPGAVAELKGAGDYVTASDHDSQAAILEVLTRESPGIPILAEEEGGTRAFRGPREVSAQPPTSGGKTMWAVDPLDGTTNFTRGFPTVAVSVALLEEGLPAVGVVLAPFLHLEFTMARGGGAFLDGERLPRHRVVDPSGAIVATGFPFRNKSLLPRYLGVMENALRRFEDLRRAGSAALDLAWTASGTFDGFFELALSTWDVAAGAGIVLEAGGVVTDWSGGDTWIETGNLIAGSPAVHRALLEIASQAPDR